MQRIAASRRTVTTLSTASPMKSLERITFRFSRDLPVSLLRSGMITVSSTISPVAPVKRVEGFINAFVSSSVLVPGDG